MVMLQSWGEGVQRTPALASWASTGMTQHYDPNAIVDWSYWRRLAGSNRKWTAPWQDVSFVNGEVNLHFFSLQECVLGSPTRLIMSIWWILCFFWSISMDGHFLALTVDWNVDSKLLRAQLKLNKTGEPHRWLLLSASARTRDLKIKGDVSLIVIPIPILWAILNYLSVWMWVLMVGCLSCICPKPSGLGSNSPPP